MIDDPTWVQEISLDQNTKAKLLLDKYTPDTIAAAYIRLYNSQKSAPEELSAVSDSSSTERKVFGPSVWFSIEGGRKQDVEAKKLLPMLSKLGDLAKNDVGKIIVQDNISYVEIKKSAVLKFTNSIGKPMRAYGNAELKQLEKLPSDVILTKAKRSSPYSDKRNSKKGHTGGGGSKSSELSRSKTNRDKKKQSNNSQNLNSFENFGLLNDEDYSEPSKQKKYKKTEPKRSINKSNKKKDKDSATPIGKTNSKKNKARRASKLKV